VRTESGKTVRVAPEEVSGIQPGATVQVTLGAETAGGAAPGIAPARDVLDSEVVAAASSPVSAAVSGTTNEVTVVRVLPQGGTSTTMPLSTVVDPVNGAVREYWAEQSNGAIQISATGWPSWVSTTAGCTDPYGIWDETADAVGFVPGPGRHLLLYIPTYDPALGDCDFAMAEQGTGRGAGGMAYVAEPKVYLIARQLGHNFGLGGSAGLACGATMEGDNCSVDPYGDIYDVMGGSSNDWPGSLNSAQADRLDVLAPGQQQVLVSNDSPSGTFRLLPMSGLTGLRAIKVVVPRNPLSPAWFTGGEYWLEYRTFTGRDTYLGGIWPWPSPGLTLRREGDAGSDYTSLLLDGRPGDGEPTWRQVGFFANNAVDVAGGLRGGGFTFTVQDVSPTGATVRIAFEGPWLTPGEELQAWGVRKSPNGKYFAQLQGNGALVVVAAGRREIWRSPGSGSGPRLVMQPDGNLVAYRSDGAVLWHAGTWGNPGARMVLQDDGNLVVYRADGVPLWWAGPDVPDQLRAGQHLAWDQYLVSRNGKYRAVGQQDGNLVVYGPGGRVVWANYVRDTAAHTVMQPDGNVVVYGAWNRVQWHSWTFGNPGAFLALQDDGNLVVYRANGTAAWWSGADRLR
jgi:hypothetical protein